MSKNQVPLKKCTLVCLDQPKARLPALYNPSKVKISKNVPWQRHPSAHSNSRMLEFTHADNRVLTLELLFDGYEDGVNVQRVYVEKLLAMAEAPKVNPNKRQAQKRRKEKLAEAERKGVAEDLKVWIQCSEYRPPFVMLVWGELRTFKGVIESIDTEYSMFLENGKPVRATCSVKMVEVDPIQMALDEETERTIVRSA